jgi:uncharacterized membrane protein YgdD (TMEM256/DUF423 family)
MFSRVWIFFGALLGAIGVAAGAYGRHGALDPVGREMFSIGVDYQLWHALALFAVAWLSERYVGVSRWAVQAVGIAFLLGVILFSGTLYAFGITGIVPIEGAAPAGGFLMIGGWSVIALVAVLGRAR